MKNLYQKNKNILILAVLALTITGVFSCINGAEALNEEPIKFTPQVSIPGSSFTAKVSSTLEYSTGPIARYISAFYNYGVGIVGIVAAMMLMIGGIIWLTAAGSSSKIEQAKSIIGSSLVGMVLVMTAVILLRTVNPALVDLKTTQVENIAERPVGRTYMITDMSQLPKDAKIGTICSGWGDVASCSVTEAPILVDTALCEEKLGKQEYLSRKVECLNQNKDISCCGQSATDSNNMNASCAGKTNGLECRTSITSTSGTGYCYNGKCLPCIRAAQWGVNCTYDYQCLGMNAPFCGLSKEDGDLIADDAECVQINGKGYCYGEVKENVDGCENRVGRGCTYDSCCTGLCCASSGSRYCMPGQQKGGSGSGQGGSPDSCIQ